MINLFLDDNRDYPEGFTIARTAKEALEIMKENKVNYLSLDHDLGKENGIELPTGYDFVKWMVDENLYANHIYLHTANPVGRENMYHYLKNAQRVGIIPKFVKIHKGPMPSDEDITEGTIFLL